MSLKRTIQIVEQMVADQVIKRYAIGGAVAALTYIEATSTTDLDILISVEELAVTASGMLTLSPIFSYLRKMGYEDFRDEGLLIEDWPVQFLPVANDLEAEGLAQAAPVDFPAGGAIIGAMVLRPEHLVAIALRVGRPKDYIRVSQFLEQERVDIDRLAGVLDRHGLRGAWVEFCRRFGIANPLPASN